MTAITQYLAATGFKEFRPKAALIDMDGTLYDSMPRHADAWMEMCRREGLHAEYDEFFGYEGRTGASTINALFQRQFGRDATDEEKTSLYQRKTEYFRELPPVLPMEGALDMLSVFREVGMQRVLVTGSGQQSVLDNISRDFPGMFDDDKRITARNVTHGKPHPEPFIKAMQLARVSPSQSIVVENAPLGVEAGDRAGAFTIGVTTGPIPREAMEEAGAAVVFSSMPEFAHMLPSLLLSLLTITSDY